MGIGDLALSATGLTKSYGGVRALVDAHLHVEAGTVHAVVGENGAGKSTLMKGLVGTVDLDAGHIEVAGRPVPLGAGEASRRAGIGIVYQELSLFPDLTVLENLFVGHFDTRLGLIRSAEMRKRAKPVLDAIGLDVDLDLPVAVLEIGERQLVEVCRVLLGRPKVLILDEPTSALREEEVERLFATIRQLRDEGVAVVYVSHRLDEVFALSDRITVLRGGRSVDELVTAETTPRQVVTAMLGRELVDLYPGQRRGYDRSGDGLRIEDLSSGALTSVSFEAQSGDIIGFAGVQGSGSDAVLPALFGVIPAHARVAEYHDGGGLPGSTVRAVQRRMCLVPGERRRYGLMMSKSIAENTSHVAVGSGLGSSRWVSNSGMERLAEDRRAELGIKAASVWQEVDFLSGGNQQKVVVGKWLSVEPRLVLLDDPTRGIDVGAKSELFELIHRLADSGAIVLFRSTEMAELAGVCDRVIVIHQGRGVGALAGADLTAVALSQAVTTGKHPAFEQAAQAS